MLSQKKKKRLTNFNFFFLNSEYIHIIIYIYIPDFRVDADIADELEPADPYCSSYGRKQRINLRLP